MTRHKAGMNCLNTSKAKRHQVLQKVYLKIGRTEIVILTASSFPLDIHISNKVDSQGCDAVICSVYQN